MASPTIASTHSTDAGYGTAVTITGAAVGDLLVACLEGATGRSLTSRSGTTGTISGWTLQESLIPASFGGYIWTAEVTGAGDFVIGPDFGAGGGGFLVYRIDAGSWSSVGASNSANGTSTNCSVSVGTAAGDCLVIGFGPNFYGSQTLASDLTLDFNSTAWIPARFAHKDATAGAQSWSSTLGSSVAWVALGIIIEGESGTEHATSGALTGQGAVISGTALRYRTHASSGALSGQGSLISGAALRYRQHPSSGSLIGQGSTISGTSVHSAPAGHASTGALTGQGSVISGVSLRYRQHATSGVLIGQGATLSGAASHKTLHATSGALTGQGSSVAGAASHKALHATSGALVGQGTTITGMSLRYRAFTSSGSLVGSGSIVSGVADHSSPGIHTSFGDLVGPGSVVSGISSHESNSQGDGGGGKPVRRSKTNPPVSDREKERLKELADLILGKQAEVKELNRERHVVQAKKGKQSDINGRNEYAIHEKLLAEQIGRITNELSELSARRAALLDAINWIEQEESLPETFIEPYSEEADIAFVMAVISEC